MKIFIIEDNNMCIASQLQAFLNPVIRHTSKISIKRVSTSFWDSLFFIFTFFYYAMSKPEKLTLSMSRTVEKISQVTIPHFMRKQFFLIYSRYYQIKLDQIVHPLDSFSTFSAFFTRQVKARTICQTPSILVSPADSKILKISEISTDKCEIIKGASYSLGELLTGRQEKLSDDQISQLKVKRTNKLYQIILYLAPGDYHRFHSPTEFQVEKRQKIEGILLSVNQKTLLRKKKVYEKNGRLVLGGTWDANANRKSLIMILVGALNVGRIKVHEGQHFQKGSQIGYFNLGSTIVMIFEAESIKQWFKKEGETVRYGDPLCDISLQN